MKFILLSFIGIGITIWRDISGGGGPIPPNTSLFDRAGNEILDRAGDNIETRV